MRGLLIALAGTAVLAASANAQVLAYWNFNASTATAQLPVSQVASGVTASLTTSVTPVTPFTGTTLNNLNGDVAGNALSFSGTNQNGATVQFRLTSASSFLNNLGMTFAARRSGTGFSNNTVSYSLNGSSFTTLGSSFNPPVDTFGTDVFSYSLPALANIQDIFIRITLGGSTGGTVRFDNVQISGQLQPVPEPFTMMLGGAAAAAYIRRRKLARK